MLRTPGARFETGRSHLAPLLLRMLDGTTATCKRTVWWLEVVLITLLFFHVDALCSNFGRNEDFTETAWLSPLYCDLWRVWAEACKTPWKAQQATSSRELHIRLKLEGDEEALRWQNSSRARGTGFHSGGFRLYFQATIFRCLSD